MVVSGMHGNFYGMQYINTTYSSYYIFRKDIHVPYYYKKVKSKIFLN